MFKIEKYYRILEIEPGASPEEIRQGYLDLTWVWHPDRFTGNPRLQKKANSKLQQINEAHDILCSLHKTYRSRKHQPQESKTHVAYHSSKESGNSGFSQSSVNNSAKNRTRTKNRETTTYCSYAYTKIDDWLD